MHFDSKQLDLMKNIDFLLEKRKIVDKVTLLMEEIQKSMTPIIERYSILFPQTCPIHQFKISKGENYRGLSYVVLDHPNFFEKQDQMALRTMFYWGQGISTTLHVAGASFERLIKNFDMRVLDELRNWHYCCHETPWEYVFEDWNYQLTTIPDALQEITNHERGFFKLAQLHPLDSSASWKEFVVDSYENLLSAIRE